MQVGILVTCRKRETKRQKDVLIGTVEGEEKIFLKVKETILNQ